MVPVEVVKEIEVEVPGPERVVERIVWRTREVEVPGPVREIIQQIPYNEPITARILIDAEKYEGTVNGNLVRGWDGIADCQVRSESIDWHTVIREPFDKTLSFTESTDEAGTLEERLASWRFTTRLGITSDSDIRLGGTWQRRGRFGFWGDIDYALNPDSTVTFVPSQETYFDVTEDRFRFAGGIAFSIGRR